MKYRGYGIIGTILALIVMYFCEHAFNYFLFEEPPPQDYRQGNDPRRGSSQGREAAARVEKVKSTWNQSSNWLASSWNGAGPYVMGGLAFFLLCAVLKCVYDYQQGLRDSQRPKEPWEEGYMPPEEGPAPNER